MSAAVRAEQAASFAADVSPAVHSLKAARRSLKRDFSGVEQPWVYVSSGWPVVGQGCAAGDCSEQGARSAIKLPKRL